MPPNYHVVVKYNSRSPVIDPVSYGLSYVALGGSPAAADFTALINLIDNPTNGTAGPAMTNPLGKYLSTTLSQLTNDVTYSIYDITGHENGTPHGPPVHVETRTLLSNSTADFLPEGVCSVITLQSPYGSDDEVLGSTHPRARDRGRLYFGPLRGIAITQEGTTGRAVLSPTFMNDAVHWVKNIQDPASIGVAWQLAVWSRAAGLLKPVSHCWVDDRPDYQRRRADQGSTRVSLNLP